MPCHIMCGGPYGFSTEQCATTGSTPRRMRLVPADRACKGIGFPVRWFHTLIVFFNSHIVLKGCPLLIIHISFRFSGMF